MSEPVPVIVVCGFLGAGKTTLLKRLLSDPQGIRYGVLVNDFGAIDIDGALLAETGADQVLLNNGCICCSIQDDLAAALDRLLASDPERIIVETSGVSRPLPVADAIAAHARAQLDGIYCLIDAPGFASLDFSATELAMDQALAADLVLLNKTDLATTAELTAVEATLRAAMPQIRLLPTCRADLPRDLLFSRGDSRDRHAHPNHHHHHDDEFEAWHWLADRPVDVARLRKAVRSLPPGILRAKGVVRVEGGDHLVFHVVGKRADYTAAGSSADTAIVAIGRRGGFDPAALTSLFDACLTPEPAAASRTPPPPSAPASSTSAEAPPSPRTASC